MRPHCLQAQRIQRKIQEEGSAAAPSDSRVSLSSLGPAPPIVPGMNRQSLAPPLLGVSMPGGGGNGSFLGRPQHQQQPASGSSGGFGMLPSLGLGLQRQQQRPAAGLPIAVDEEFKGGASQQLPGVSGSTFHPGFASVLPVSLKGALKQGNKSSSHGGMWDSLPAEAEAVANSL